MPGLLLFDINQLKASLHLLLHLFSSVPSACLLSHSSAILVCTRLTQDIPDCLVSVMHKNHNIFLF